MRNPAGRQFSRGIGCVSAKEGAIEGLPRNTRPKSARSGEEPPPWVVKLSIPAPEPCEPLEVRQPPL